MLAIKFNTTNTGIICTSDSLDLLLKIGAREAQPLINITDPTAHSLELLFPTNKAKSHIAHTRHTIVRLTFEGAVAMDIDFGPYLLARQVDAAACSSWAELDIPTAGRERCVECRQLFPTPALRNFTTVSLTHIRVCANCMRHRKYRHALVR
jgi:hypothetical protein